MVGLTRRVCGLSAAPLGRAAAPPAHALGHPGCGQLAIAMALPLVSVLCAGCGKSLRQMRLIAVITDPAEVRKILRHLLQIGRAPPGLHPSALN
jgi:hypothetical protein